jgi:hypothetical protein
MELTCSSISLIALTPGALNDVQIVANDIITGEPGYAENVYEWHEGHVYLLSGGHDVSGTTSFVCGHQSSVYLLGADGTGANVFFTTGSSLVPADTDTEMDVYDARVCTAAEPCVAAAPSSVPCQGEACHGTPGIAPGSVAAASVTFTGPGNLAAPPTASKKAAGKKTAVKCAKRKRSKHGRCVKTRKKAKAKRARSTHGGEK